MRNIRLLIAYDGTDFHGWQRQPDQPTIQGCIEAAVEKITTERVNLYGSGRTDAGVHASNQVANFKTMCTIPCPNLLNALNNLLPSTVRIKRAHEVADSFHARYDVRSKTYRYRILVAPISSPFVGRFVYHHPYPLDRERMAVASRLLEGEHDFTSFAASPGEARASQPTIAEAAREALTERPPGSPWVQDGPRPNAESQILNPGSLTMVRTIFSSRIFWRPKTCMLIYQVQGSGFLHHMVRNIVGTLLEVGRGNFAPQDILQILDARDRTRAGPTAPASGLCLVKVEY